MIYARQDFLSSASTAAVSPSVARSRVRASKRPPYWQFDALRRIPHVRCGGLFRRLPRPGWHAAVGIGVIQSSPRALPGLISERHMLALRQWRTQEMLDPLVKIETVYF